MNRTERLRAASRSVILGLLLASSAGCLGPYRVEVREGATGAPATAVVEIAQVEKGPEQRELFWTRTVWLGPDLSQKISLWDQTFYRVVLFERPDPKAPIPERETWSVLARWARSLRPGEDAGTWHPSVDGRYELRLMR